MSDGMPDQENVKSVPALGVPVLVRVSAVLANCKSIEYNGRHRFTGLLTRDTSVTTRDKPARNGKNLTRCHGNIESLRDGCAGPRQDIEHCLMTSLDR